MGGDASFLVCIGVLALLGFVAIIAAVIRSDDEDTLRREGGRLVASVIKLDHWIDSYSDGEGAGWTQHRYRVLGLWTDPHTGAQRAFESKELNSQPNCREGDPVIVFVDPRDPSRYLMDI